MNTTNNFSQGVVDFSKRHAELAARLALFIVFSWFGFLKVIDLSPATGLVTALLSETMPWMSEVLFVRGFGVLEVIIGLLFLFPRLTRVAVTIFLLHMATTFMPLFFLPEISWQKLLTPTLEGQYIIKNLVLIALVMSLALGSAPRSATARKQNI